MLKKTAIVLIQLGTPASAEPHDVQEFLYEFLSDSKVVRLNKWFWLPLLKGIILPKRVPTSAQNYQRLFNNYGALLRIYTNSLAKKLELQMGQTVFIAMRYGLPKLKNVLLQLQKNDEFRQILLVPLFPHYSDTTTGSVVAKVNQILAEARYVKPVRWFYDFYDHPLFIESWWQKIKSEPRFLTCDAFVFSYHGLPTRYIKEGDPYALQVQKTTDLLSQKIASHRKIKMFSPQDSCRLENHLTIVQAFQSRFGKEEWLKPYLEEELKMLAQKGFKRVVVVAPAFVCDCIETIDEINREMKHLFISSGGEDLFLLPSLNDEELWVKSLAQMLEEA